LIIYQMEPTERRQFKEWSSQVSEKFLFRLVLLEKKSTQETLELSIHVD
jgi:hypothetical protein